ncbi:MAG: hypothetical protein Q9169_000004 [Polycauliona sp. 2 TL-2023]
MDISQAASHLLADNHSLGTLPTDVIKIIRSGSNKQYLDTLARLALQPSKTPTIFSVHNALSVELCSRWLQYAASGSHAVEVLAALARIMPLAPYLSPYIGRLLQSQKEQPLASLFSGNLDQILEIQELPLQDILLALCRLLQFDNQAFAHLVVPAQLQLLLNHTHLPIRYLVIRILCLYLHASESTLQEMVGKHIGQEDVQGGWDDKNIDYRFFSLWEKQRLRNMTTCLRKAQQEHAAPLPLPAARRIIAVHDLSPATTCIAGTLLPSPVSSPSVGSSLVLTRTVAKNMQSLAEAIKCDRPVLLTGPLGAGKSSLVRDAAKRLGMDDNMLVLHLNEQIDAKLLIGMYTTVGGPGSFQWQPGVLTKAVTEGRWVLVEDFDRSPADIVSMLLPLLERKELLIPHWGETIRAAPGFKIIATIRSSEGREGVKTLSRRTLLGARHWEQVYLQAPPIDELGEIVNEKFPILHAYTPRLMGLYARLKGGLQSKSKAHFDRSPSPQDLFRWCSRIDHLLKIAGIRSGNEPVPEVVNDNILLEAMDCFVSRLPGGLPKEEMIHVVGQELQISSERVSYCLHTRKPEYVMKEKTVRIGRARLKGRTPSAASSTTKQAKSNPFATTHSVLRHLESIALAIQMAEPCLLVGETGTGKTTMIQELAQSLNHKLVVVNLSQQSEAGDLLGGFKPVNMRALAIPLKEEFSDLIEGTLSARKNQRYIEHISKAASKAISKNNWSRTLTLWRDAATTIRSTLQPTNTKIHGEPLVKRRKVETPRYQALSRRWEDFIGQLSVFQKHLESGSKGFAFSIVEGNIVKAARNGDWVLLDEINLAAPDTLDSIADLLAHGGDDGPSLLLTETGDTERIRAHKDFRIFGAMNPASDVGKRDLPISLRSRFTELFIDVPDKDLDNLIPLVQAYLGSNGHADTRIFSDVAHLYLEIQNLARDNRLVDGAGQKPHFSLRTLTRTLIYVIDIAPTYGLRRALFEGFSMSFLTLLDTASASQITPMMDKYLLGKKNSKALLLQAPKAPQDTKDYVKFEQYWVMRGSVPVKSQPHYIITPFIKKNLLNLVRATSTRRFPVLLQGPTSSGKTSMVEYLANISGNKFVRINNHEHTDLQEYLGTYVSGADGQLQYQEGILVQALREGFWIVLDELNLAPTDVLEALNRLLDDNRELLIPETQQIVRPHHNFMLFATQNPPGIYGGRKVLSRAFRNRFLELHFDDIPEDELEIILRERSQIAPSFCTKIVAVYKKLSLHRQHSRLYEQKNSFATLRDLFRWAFRDADDRQQLAVNGFFLLAERVRDVEGRQVVKQIIEEVLKTKINEDAAYAMNQIPPDLTAFAPAVVLTKSMRRLYVLVTQALKNHEPVLLVGETGSGKTTVCQVVAAVMQLQLHIVNAHQNLETGDLIGSQRPIRSRQSIEGRLHEQLSSLLSEHFDSADLGDNSLRNLIRLYQDCPAELVKSFPLPARHSLDQSLSQLNALFEWVDGSLVSAMKAGNHFLLDEISLADDSVLERLNSVLEPNRRLYLAEKGVDDALVTAADGFQFLATMNPGGDYGKKELSPALRNRFTEIWVPHASDHDEMEEILSYKLGESQAHFAKAMVAFAHWYSVTFATATPHLSTRDLLAWVDFFNTQCIVDNNLALLHGAALVYIDALGANPAAKLQIAGSIVEKERSSCLQKLSELFQCDMGRLYYIPVKLGYEVERLTIGPFSLEKYPGASLDPRYSLQAPTTRKNAMMIARALQLPRPILLEGNPGVGKTTLVAAIAQACGMPLTRINLSDQTDLMDLFGSDVPIEGGTAGQFEWREAPFLRAMQQGHWVLLDEMNLASQSVLEGLNACFDHRGQVYVSELDRTFTRHPKFVVFAAQNPHHQGSGRKGLPASFVNRFTVVYADTFMAEDLQIICSEKFPSVPLGDISKLTECVAEVEAALQQRRQLGIQGGPWEINLRDTTRWLDLLASQSGLLSAGNASDFVAMLFSQRFRSSEDAATITALLARHLTHPMGQRERTLGIHPSHVQVGLGLLSRQPSSSCAITQHISLPYCHLPLLESIVICIRNNWPVLLVGPSGSGKTELIRQLASCAGADLVEFSINADMDTTDLVGGYEQLDSQRHSAAYTRRLEDFARKARLEGLKCFPPLSSQSLTELEITLMRDAADMTKIVDVLHKVIQEHPDSGFDACLHEGKLVLEQSLADNRARFEWVDGVLVKSVTEGKWLILDNSNLCSPSVLDRLNSLLEPNGVLIINERHSPDGSARIVKPHPNFRIFLTMDPQHGELSRAMRNRNVELFLPMPQTPRSRDGIDLLFDPATVRFDSFQKILSSSIPESDFEELVWIGLDHLAFADHDLISSWGDQILAGLIQFTTDRHHAFLSAVQLFRSLFPSATGCLNGLKKVYHRIPRHLSLPLGFETIQTIQPLNNPVLVTIVNEGNRSVDLFQYGMVVDLMIDTVRFEDTLVSAMNSTANQPPSEMSRLQRSVASNTSRRFNEDSTRPLASFLTESVRILRLTFEQFHDTTLASHLPCNDNLLAVKSYLLFLTDVFDLAHFSDFDEATFRLYLERGRDLISALKLQPPNTELSSALELELDRFGPSWQLRSGQSMYLIWSQRRPRTPASVRQLDINIQIEQLADRFDGLLWTTNVPLSGLNKLRSSITQTARMTENVNIMKALDELDAERDLLTESKSPYLQSEFEGLRQYQSASINANGPEAEVTVGLLAAQPTRTLWQQCFEIADLTGINKNETSLATIRGVFPEAVLKKLERLTEVPLKSLDLLRQEIMVMATNTAKLTSVVTGDSQSVFLQLLRKLHCQVVAAHKDYLHPFDRPEAGSGHNIWQLKEELSPSHYLRKVVDRFLQPSWGLIAGVDDYDGLKNTATAWILFFTGCLHLYVPDHPYDPALKSRVVQDRHRKRTARLHKKLSALQKFEQLTTGQDTNLRCQVLEEELAAIGQEPATEAVLRPMVSQLGQLQGEFSNILQSIVFRSPDQQTLDLLSNGDQSVSLGVGLLQSNITQATIRLSQGYRTYDDITKPLEEMLNGLAAGLAMAQIAAAPEIAHAKAVQFICQSTPFFGMRPKSSEWQDYDSSISSKEDVYDIGLKFIESFTVINSMTKSPSASTFVAVFEAFHHLYEDWKQQLSEDQRKDLARSSMYRYRGGEADAGADDEKDFDELFPDFEVGADQSTSRPRSQQDPRETAQRLAHYHRRLCESELDPAERLMDLMRSSFTDIARISDASSALTKSSVPTQTLLCGLIFKLDSTVENLEQTSSKPSSSNFYRDANLGEAQKVVSLMRRLQARFVQLKQAWPEHSTLDDVLVTATELLALKHTEPIARLITKVEQLHGYVCQWQMVASREYTAADLYDDMTRLIVDWRRLELSTWSRLLDMEDKKCEEEVDSWWFVAYEAIVAAPLSIMNSGDELQGHAEELFKTLQSFIIDSSIGHFSPRLRMLQNFRDYVALIQQSTPSFAIVHRTLSNLLAFYSRFEVSIKHTLQIGRLALEKEMKDVLLLASWKDININALKESAKRSHRKLFKVVRKYRNLLARPAQNSIEQAFPEPSHASEAAAALTSVDMGTPEIDGTALQTCQQSLQTWSERPARFTNISNTVTNMSIMSRIPSSMLDVPAILDQLTSDLGEDVKALRKETPSTATDENTDLLKHLTARKRKVFSDVLKSIRHMGFRSNMGTDILAQQASLAVILTKLPPLDMDRSSAHLGASEHYLHQFCKLMPAVREASSSHSEDLNGSEITRSIGYFESLLSAVIKQRTTLGELASNLNVLDGTIGKMQNVSKQDSLCMLQDTSAHDSENVRHLVQCLPYIIATGCFIVEKHAKFGELSHDGIIADLQEWGETFRRLAVAMGHEPTLPDNLTSSMTSSNKNQERIFLDEFKVHLRKMIQDHDNLAFVLQEIKLWTEISRETTNGHMDHVASLEVKDIDQDLLKFCDSILVAIQAFEKTTSEICTPEDRNWLVSSEKTLANSVRSLHVAKLCKSMDEILSNLCRLGQADLNLATAVTAMSLPIVRRYRDICYNVLDYTSSKSLVMNKMATTLAQSFTQIASQGFCNPSKAGPTEAGKNEKLEEGTGLGEGEGAEDISKDVQDDEDLTDLAQEGQKRKEGEEIEDQEDAVNMDQEELEGEMGDAEEKEDDGDEGSEAGSNDNEIDEETGDVDDLDPNAVDEKLWDDTSKEAEKDKEGEKAKGKSKKDDQAHTEGEKNNKDGEDAEEDEHLSETGAEEGEEVAQQEGEMMDPRAQQEENLDLPDEMDLDGPDKASGQSDIGDSDLDALSNVDSEGDEDIDAKKSDVETVDETSPKDEQAIQDQEIGNDGESDEGDIDKADEAGSPVDTEPDEDEESNEGLLQNQNDEANVDKNNVAPSDVQGLNGQDADNEADTQMQENKAAGDTGTANDQVQADHLPQAAAKEGELGNQQAQSQEASDNRDPSSQDYTSQAFKKLGDALETWHRQQRKIQDARSSPAPEAETADVDMANTEFEHLADEDTKADTQALGAASEDQANTLDQRALDNEMQDQPQDFLPDEVDRPQDEDTIMEEPDAIQNSNDKHQEQPKPSTFIGPNTQQRPPHDPHSLPTDNESLLHDLPTSLSLTSLSPPSPSTQTRSLASAQALWTHHSSTTHPLSLILTSQLRLILSPTLATKMRGDFRTGKRLNIKRIIPYIASDYKRDKIWMRRSVPQKRNYQIMLAVDDSLSMAALSSSSYSRDSGVEGGDKGDENNLAFETLALISKSLSMLESGSLCILSFGSNVTIAHPFSTPFNDAAGPSVLQHFSFQQRKTNILKLVQESITLFREARAGDSRGAGEETWQLEMIISDGVFEDHEKVERLVREAMEERIMIVFIIVDAAVIQSGNSDSMAGFHGTGTREGVGEGKEKQKATSIVDMQTAVFVDADAEGGEKKLQIRRYLDGFPFGYYVVVGDVRELPGVLSQALRGWFGEVAERGAPTSDTRIRIGIAEIGILISLVHFVASFGFQILAHRNLAFFILLAQRDFVGVLRRCPYEQGTSSYQGSVMVAAETMQMDPVTPAAAMSPIEKVEQLVTEGAEASGLYVELTGTAVSVAAIGDGGPASVTDVETALNGDIEPAPVKDVEPAPVADDKTAPKKRGRKAKAKESLAAIQPSSELSPISTFQTVAASFVAMMPSNEEVDPASKKRGRDQPPMHEKPSAAVQPSSELSTTSASQTIPASVAVAIAPVADDKPAPKKKGRKLGSKNRSAASIPSSDVSNNLPEKRNRPVEDHSRAETSKRRKRFNDDRSGFQRPSRAELAHLDRRSYDYQGEDGCLRWIRPDGTPGIYRKHPGKGKKYQWGYEFRALPDDYQDEEGDWGKFLWNLAQHACDEGDKETARQAFIEDPTRESNAKYAHAFLARQVIRYVSGGPSPAYASPNRSPGASRPLMYNEMLGATHGTNNKLSAAANGRSTVSPLQDNSESQPGASGTSRSKAITYQNTLKSQPGQGGSNGSAMTPNQQNGLGPFKPSEKLSPGELKELEKRLDKLVGPNRWWYCNEYSGWLCFARDTPPPRPWYKGPVTSEEVAKERFVAGFTALKVKGHVQDARFIISLAL